MKKISLSLKDLLNSPFHQKFQIDRIQLQTTYSHLNGILLFSSSSLNLTGVFQCPGIAKPYVEPILPLDLNIGFDAFEAHDDATSLGPVWEALRLTNTLGSDVDILSFRNNFNKVCHSIWLDFMFVFI
jgi:hypothetical protein